MSRVSGMTAQAPFLHSALKIKAMHPALENAVGCLRAKHTGTIASPCIFPRYTAQINQQEPTHQHSLSCAISSAASSGEIYSHQTFAFLGGPHLWHLRLQPSRFPTTKLIFLYQKSQIPCHPLTWSHTHQGPQCTQMRAKSSRK